MKTTYKTPEFFSFFKYLFILFSFLIFNSIESQVYPYSTALFVAFMVNGCSVTVTPILYLLSFLILSKPTLLLSALPPAVLFFLVVIIYRKLSVTPGIETLLFTALSLTLFVLIGDTKTFIPVNKRIVCSLLTVLLTFISLITIKAITQKGLKFKFGYEEYLSLALLTAVFGLGVCNLISPYAYKTLSLFILLLIVFLFRSGTGALVSAVLGLSLAIYYKNIDYVSVYLLWNLFSTGFTKFSRYLGAISVLACDFFIEQVFSVYGYYGRADILCLIVAILAFCIIPTKLLIQLKDKLYYFREKQLVRQTINRNRLTLSNRLFELSTVFNEMANAFTTFNRKKITENQAREGIEKQIWSSVCNQCENFQRCKRKEGVIAFNIGKMTDIGFAKGKISFVDIPKEITELCLHPNNLLFGINKLLADYRAYQLENANLLTGREIIASEAVGVSEILRGLALETGAMLKYHNRLERSLAENLFKNGFHVNEILIFGEEELLTVSLMVCVNEFSLQRLQNVINQSLKTNLSLKDKCDVGENKCYLSFTKSAEYDAVFGVAKATKDGSNASGDTHSVVRISKDKFLLALSDGMGSGEFAQSISSASLSLIESFYKAGLKSYLILNTVNKLLSINTEDTFTALDVSIVDLVNCSADFIKYGSPYGFIVGDNGIKIVEGNSLPLGIIEELKPSVCNTPLTDGDMIVLVTDGVSDAFSSSSEVIDFLRTVSAKNPQTLANELLSHAIKLNDGDKKDDMTVLAVRVFKRNNLA